MRRVISRLAIGAVLALGVAPLAAQAPQPQAAQPALKLSKKEREALGPIQNAINAKDYATATAGLNAAQSVVETPDGRYAFSNLQFTLGRDSNNLSLAVIGLEGMVASGKIPAASLPTMYRNIVGAAASLNDQERVNRALTRYLELSPNDAEATLYAAQVRVNQKRIAEALPLLERAISLQKAAGQPVPETWYKFAFGQAYSAKLASQTTKFGREWISAHPNPKNWRDTLIVLRELSKPDSETDLDIFRLMRANKALAGERDYAEYARALSLGGYPGEAKALLDEGVATKVVDSTRAPFNEMRASYATRAAADRPTLAGEERAAMAAASGVPALRVANAYLGYGEYAKAIALYRTALQKGSVDANLVNTRLGLALGLAGQKVEAQAAVKSITGTRSELASYMLIWLSTPA